MLKWPIKVSLVVIENEVPTEGKALEARTIEQKTGQGLEDCRMHYLFQMALDSLKDENNEQKSPGSSLRRCTETQECSPTGKGSHLSLRQD